jgi:hypothetical protein
VIPVTDSAVYLRAPLVGDALARVNALRVPRGVPAVALSEYSAEAERQVLQALASRGISEGEITAPEALVTATAHLAAALVFEAASVRNDAVSGLVDVFASQARVHRERYLAELLAAQPQGPSVRPRGASFTWWRC